MQLFIALIIDTTIYLLGGVVLKLLWGWFLVPLTLPPLGIVHAIGITIVVGLLTHQHLPSQDESALPEIPWSKVGRVVIIHLWALFAGFTAHLFM